MNHAVRGFGVCRLHFCGHVSETQTHYVIPSVECLGNGACEAGLPVLSK